MELRTRYQIVGVEVVGLGAFVLLLAYLELRQADPSGLVQGFTWVWGVVGITLILVGLEIPSLNRLLPASTP